MTRLHKRPVPGNGVEKRAGRPEAALPKQISARPARSGRGRRPGPVVCVPRARRGPKPPTSAPRPLQALACCWSRTYRSVGHSSARAGETQVAFLVPAQKGNPCPRIGKSVPAAQAGGSVFEQPVGEVPKRGRLQGPLAGKQRTRPQAACATDHALSCVRQAARMPLAAPCQRRSDNRPDAPRADCKSCRAAVPPDTVGPP